MSVLSEFFIGDDGIARQYDGDRSVAPQKAELKNLTELEVSTLWSLLVDKEWDESLLDQFSIVNQQGGRTTVNVPDEFLSDLTSREYCLDGVASQWAATEELQWEPSDAREVVDALASLAHVALSSGRHVYLWVCP